MLSFLCMAFGNPNSSSHTCQAGACALSRQPDSWCLSFCCWTLTACQTHTKTVSWVALRDCAQVGTQGLAKVVMFLHPWGHSPGIRPWFLQVTSLQASSVTTPHSAFSHHTAPQQEGSGGKGAHFSRRETESGWDNKLGLTGD